MGLIFFVVLSDFIFYFLFLNLDSMFSEFIGFSKFAFGMQSRFCFLKLFLEFVIQMEQILKIILKYMYYIIYSIL